MNVQNIDRINVCLRYFHTDDIPIKKYADILKADANITMNKVVSKKEAIRFIMERCTNRNRLSSLSISWNPIHIDKARDFKGEKIFHKENEKYCGWLLQYDPTPFANWYHDCFYYFVVNQDAHQEIQHNRGICDTIKMQKIS